MRFNRTILFRLAVASTALCCSIASGDERSLSSSRPVQRSSKMVTAPRRPEFLQSVMADSKDLPEDDDEVGNEFGFAPSEVSEGSMSLISRPQSSTESLNRPLTSQIEEFSNSDPLDVNSICAEEDCGPAVDDCDKPIVRFRKSFYQGVSTSFGYVHDDPATGMSVTTLDGSANFAMPIMGDMDNLLSFTPYIRTDMLDAAAVFDVPDQLFDTGFKVFWRKVIDDRWSSMVLFTPSYRSDFQSSDGAFRIFGMGLLVWQCVPDKLSLSGGVVHTGRADFPVLPAIGLIWTPTPEWKFDVQFPSPRISRRVMKDGQNSETWAYLSGVFGGNTWAVERPSGTEDELTIRDLRLVIGLEQLLPENRGLFIETGYVFNRSVEYERIPSERELDSAIMLRGGISF